MTPLTAFLLVSPTIFMIVMFVINMLMWNRREKSWLIERTRLLDMLVSPTAAEFRIRQSTPPNLFEEGRPHPQARQARPHRPQAIGLDGGAL